MMLEISPRSRTKRELTNRIDQMTEMTKNDRIIQMRLVNPFSEISDQFLTSWTLGLKKNKILYFPNLNNSAITRRL